MDKSESTQPPLCAKGCGFYGSPATNNLCSKCFKDHLKQQAANLEIRRKQQIDAVNSSVVLEIPATNPFPCFKRLAVQSSVAGATTTTSATDQIDNTTSATTKTSNRCEACKKKVRLPGFGCRCGKLFCVDHRYPEAHGCDKLVEYKIQGRARLAEENPITMADKLDNRL